MTFSDALSVIFTVLGGIVNVLMSVLLFGVPLGAFFVIAFIISNLLSTVFGIEKQEVQTFSQWNQSQKKSRKPKK